MAKLLRRCWHDPVGSKVIAALIIAVGGIVLVRAWAMVSSQSFASTFRDIWRFVVSSGTYPNALVLLLVLVCCALLWQRFRRGARLRAYPVQPTPRAQIGSPSTDSVDQSLLVPTNGAERSNVPPPFLVGRWEHSFLDRKSGRERTETATIHGDGKYFVGNAQSPQFQLRKFNCEWARGILTFDKVDIKSGEVQARERLEIRERGRYLVGQAKGKQGDKRAYRRMADQNRV